MTCSTCTNQINEGARYCSACGTPVFSPRTGPVKTRLYRVREGKAIAGICAGFAQTYGWDVVPVRLILVALVIFGCGAPVLAYLIAWIVMPQEPFFFAPPSPMPPGTQPVA